MTVGMMHKLLGALVAQGHARKPLCISKTTFRDNCESDGVTILPVYGCDLDWVLQSDGDGGCATNKDGSERGRWNAVLYGSMGTSSAPVDLAAEDEGDVPPNIMGERVTPLRSSPTPVPLTAEEKT